MNQLLKAAHQRAAYEAKQWELMSRAAVELIMGWSVPPVTNGEKIVGRTSLSSYREKR